MIKRFWIVMCTLGLGALPGLASAQTYPGKPVRWIVPFQPGGTTDIIARLVGQKLSESWNQPVVIENRPGASGVIGTQAGAKAAPDGYTLTFAYNGNMTMNPNLIRKLPYDPFNAFIPVAKMTGSYSIATARLDAPFNSITDLAAAARKAPGKYTFGSAGLATATHLAGEMVALKAGITLLHVPYKGSADALTDLIGGRIDMIFDPVSLTQVKAGKVKAIGVMSAKRHPELPNVPTVQEQGFDVDTRSWFGMFAPKGTPKAIVDRMAAEIEKVLKADDTRATLLKVSQYADFSGPAAFADQVKRDSDFFKDLIKTANIHVD